MASRRFVEQLRVVQDALNVPLAAGPTGTGPADPPCAFQRGTILVGSEDAGWLQESSDSPLRHMSPRRQSHPERAGLVRLSVGSAVDEAELGDPTRRDLGDPMRPDDDVPEALDRLKNMADRRAIDAAPNHIIGITNGTICPADEPWPTTEPRSVRDVAPAPADHRRPLVLVIDTGLVAEYGLLGFGDGISGAARKNETTTGPDGQEYIREYVGHGTFITGLLKAVAPTALVQVSNVLDQSGAALEDDFTHRLFAALDQFQAEHSDWPDIISLSAGSPALKDLHHLPVFSRFIEAIRDKPTLLVAAAGNNGNSIRFWPAAYAAEPSAADFVVSVGALRECLTGRACFSDFGPWVKVFAPGERLVSGFSGAARKLQYQHATFEQCQFLPPADNYCCACRAPYHGGALSHESSLVGGGSVADFTGTHDARWSGTSFATPLVAGYVAQRMARENRADARGVYADMRKNAERIDIAGETALKIVPTGFTVQPMDVDC
ncbi:S8 family serine peptidase [Actinomadura scrupuli]|uniref:S8 family serine peptidase n=1 Tax=Actinomadura scrupuli TaxID=559629 RepID=UPI003D96D7AD